ncbi:MAG: ATP-dependent DNA ligase [Dehalococcoidia bacterium]|nr:ATP-dependent DNA ligase [Dehalococcoidia bacterium]
MPERARIDAATFRPGNPDKVLFPADGITKAGLVDYYRQVAPVMLPHLAGRPLTMHRFPDGIKAGGFYQKNASDHFPSWVRRVRVAKETSDTTYVVCDDIETLLYLVDQATVVFHVMLSRVERPEHPDRLIFDLDPPADGEPREVQWAARTVRALLHELSLEAFVQTSGSKGMHVVVPLDGSADFDTARDFARDAAEVLAGRHPERLTTEVRRAKRLGRLYLDVGRNTHGATAVCPYSVRALPGAPVATPLDWSEAGRADIGPQRYTTANLPRRLARKRDPWADMDAAAQPLDQSRERLSALSAP